MSILSLIDISNIQSKLYSIINNWKLCTLSLDATLPSREVIMTPSIIKTQLPYIVSQYLVDMLSINYHRSKFIVTFSETTPMQIQNGKDMT